MVLRTSRLLLGVLVTSQALAGCTSWRVVRVSPQALVDSARPNVIRVKERGGARFVLDAPYLVGDTLLGTVRHKLSKDSVEHLPRRLPLAAVDHLAVKQGDVLKTVGAIGLGVFAGLAAYVVVALVSCGSKGCD